MILSDEDKSLIKSLYLKGFRAKRLTDEFPQKSWTKRGVNKVFKKLRDTGTAAVADSAVPALRKTLILFFRSSRSLPLTLFCWLSGEVTENTFSSLNKTQSVAYCGNFWSRNLARFMRAARFACVGSCARRLMKHFRCKSLQIIWDTNDRWMSVSHDISRTDSCGSAACPLDSELNHYCLNFFFSAGTNSW